MMKNTNKYIIPLVMGLMLHFASCSDEPHPARGDVSKYIVFDPPKVVMAGSGSRSVIENEIGGNFAVYGYCVPRIAGNTGTKDWFNASLSWNEKSSYVTPHVFSNQTVAPDGKYSMTGGALKEWEADNGYDAANFRYSFIAHYPASGGRFSMNRTGDGNANTSMGVPVLTFTMPWNGGNAAVERNHSEIPDLMYAASFDHRKSDGQVPLRFNHLLTAFRFKINNYTGLKLIVKKVSLTGSFNRSATMSFNTTTPERSEVSGSFGATFVISDIEQTLASQSSGDTYLGASAANNNDGVTIMLMPGLNSGNSPDFNYLGSNTRLLITYEVRNEQTDAVIGSYNEVAAAFNPSRPLAGTRYAVNLNFVGNEFVLIFTPESDNWESGSDNDIIIN